MLTLSVPAGLAVVGGDAGHGLLQRGQRGADLRQEALAALGQREAARAALEQPHAQPRLQPRHVLADRRRRQPQAPRGRREAAAFGALHEGFEVVERFHAPHCPAHLQPPVEFDCAD
jgi:hypothetical protein